MPFVAYDDVNGVLYMTVTESEAVGNPNDYQARILFSRSVDQGDTWSQPMTLSSLESTSSCVVTGPDGEVYVIWEDYGQNAVVLRRSLDSGVSFEPSVIVSQINDNLVSGPPWYFARVGKERANPAYDGCSFRMAPNRPAIAVDRSTGPYRGRVYVTWTEMAAGTLGPAGPPMANLEPNNAYYQAQPITVGQTLEGFVVPAERGPVDRDYFSVEGVAGQTIVLESEVTFVDPQPPPTENARCFSIWTVCDTTRGTRNGIDMREEWRGPLPPLVMTFPESRRYYIVAGVNPPYVNGYRFRLRELTVSPASVSRDQRDIVMVSSSDGGQTWSTMRRVNDDPPLHDNSFPQVAVDDVGGVHCVWYDRRHDKECDRTVMTYWALSRDGGQTFSNSGPVSRVPSDWVYTGVPSNIGDGFGIATSGESVHIAWTQSGVIGDYNIHAVSLTPPPVGVLLSRFSARLETGRAVLRWHLEESNGVVECRVERLESGSTDGFIDLGASVAAPDRSHLFVDPSARVGGEYEYRIRAMLRDGTSELLGPYSVKWIAVSGVPVMGPMIPNPFTGTARTVIRLPVRTDLEVAVFDVQGRTVRRLLKETADAGEREVLWDGRDDRGTPAPPGNYFVRMTTSEGVAGRKVTLR